MASGRSARGKLAVEVGRGHAAIHQEVATGDERAVRAHQQSGDGGDLDFAKPDSYVPEFSKALTALKKGEMTDAPVKTQFGFHIIKLEDTREAKFPPLEEVKSQIQQRLNQMKMAKYRDEIRAKSKTDYKFAN